MKADAVNMNAEKWFNGHLAACRLRPFLPMVFSVGKRISMHKVKSTSLSKVSRGGKRENSPYLDLVIKGELLSNNDSLAQQLILVETIPWSYSQQTSLQDEARFHTFG